MRRCKRVFLFRPCCVGQRCGKWERLREERWMYSIWNICQVGQEWLMDWISNDNERIRTRWWESWLEEQICEFWGGSGPCREWMKGDWGKMSLMQKGVEVHLAIELGRQWLGWMDGVNSPLDSRGIIAKETGKHARERCEWRRSVNLWVWWVPKVLLRPCLPYCETGWPGQAKTRPQ